MLTTGSWASAAAGVTPTGETTTVDVEARDMRFWPSTIPVPAGNRLVLEVANTDDEDVHDLVLDDGSTTGRLSPGDTARLDIGVVGRDLEGWCSILGHRQMGMVLEVHVTGTPPPASDAEGHGDHPHGPAATDDSTAGTDDAAGHDHGSLEGGGSAADALDFMATPSASFRARDAVLPPLERGQVHRHTFVVREVVREVAPGVTQRLWTYNGTMPGPILHSRVGDEFVITLVNRGTVGHSIDFHAGSLAPQRPMRTIAPGESLVYRFRATRAGVWMYHCATMPMSAHIANGLFGAVVIEPRGLPTVDRSYLIVQSELYLDAVAFNGYVNQYDHRPLPARVGERVRVWVVDAGPNRPSALHVVGGQFDTVYAEGNYLLGSQRRDDHHDGGSQALALQPSQGGFVELTFPEPGDYPFITHVMIDSERGAHGLFQVTR